MNKLLQKLKDRNKIVSIYVDGSGLDSHSLGYIDWVGGGFVSIKSIRPSGEFDGYELRKLEDISRVETDRDYENSILTMFNGDFSYQEIELDIDIENTVGSVINQAVEQNCVVAIYTDKNPDEVTGLITSFENGLVEIQALNECGEKSEIIYLLEASITAIDFNMKSDQQLKYICLHS